MDSNPYFFLGLPEAADARITRWMSFLMDATNFRVGTRFSSALLPFSIGGSL
jgi:hypothetical protein